MNLRLKWCPRPVAARKAAPTLALAAPPLGLRPLARLTSLLLALVLVAPLTGAVSSAQAQEPIVRDHRAPSARIMLVIKKIIVHEDMDWGNGEISVNYTVRTNPAYCPDSGCGQAVIEGQLPQFTATDGWVQQTDRQVPAAGDVISDRDASPEVGIPLRPGPWYGVTIAGIERDAAADDWLGYLHADITDQNGQVRFGTHTERGFRNTGPAAFSVEYEIKHAALPDLRPVNITVTNLPNSAGKRVCTAVQNIESGQAGPFQVALYVNGAEAPGGRPSHPALAPGQHADLCQETQLPASGQLQLRAVVDEPLRVTEYNETNNSYEEAYAAS